MSACLGMETASPEVSRSRSSSSLLNRFNLKCQWSSTKCEYTPRERRSVPRSATGAPRRRRRSASESLRTTTRTRRKQRTQRRRGPGDQPQAGPPHRLGVPLQVALALSRVALVLEPCFKFCQSRCVCVAMHNSNCKLNFKLTFQVHTILL